MTGISKTERANILVLSGLISVVSLLNQALVYWQSVANPLPVGIYDNHPASRFPFGRLLSIFVFLFVLFSRKYFISLVWSLLCLLIFVREFIAATDAINTDLYYYLSKSALQLLYLIANPLDYLTTGLLLILVLWQLSVVIRPLVFRRDAK
jgi:hypothetical protein